jgi:hypothetical protein
MKFRSLSLMLILIAFLVAFVGFQAQARETVTLDSSDITVTSGSVTATKSYEFTGTGVYSSFKGLEVWTLDWTSDANGNVVANIEQMTGTIMRAVTNPEDGATSPTANYDITLSDSDGIDLLTGLAANRSATDNENICPLFTQTIADSASTNVLQSVPVVAGDVDLAITNAGAARGGILKVYLMKD